MKISELSKRSGVSQRMLRYMEQLGLLTPMRNESDYRKYGRGDLERILEIRELQRLGLSLKEVGRILDDPHSASEVLTTVFHRERDAYLERQRALRDLRERLSGSKNPYFETRIAHTIPDLETLTADLSDAGWECSSANYLKFGEWQSAGMAVGGFQIGEIVWQSSIYVLHAEGTADVERFMAQFCKCANRVWPSFDGHPPKNVEFEDLGEFFAPSDVVLELDFEGHGSRLSLLLPYATLFPLAKCAVSI